LPYYTDFAHDNDAPRARGINQNWYFLVF
jgi:hypothetical protein